MIHILRRKRPTKAKAIDTAIVMRANIEKGFSFSKVVRQEELPKRTKAFLHMY